MGRQTKGNPALLAAGALTQMLTGLPAAWGVLQKPLGQTLGLQRPALLAAFALLVAGYGAGCVAGGLLQDKLGPKPPALMGTALLAGGFFVAAALPQGSAVGLAAGFGLPAGVGGALLCPGVMACVQAWYSEKKGFATGAAGVGMGLSGLFYTLAVHWLAEPRGLRLCLALLGAVALAGCGGAALLLKLPPGPKSTQGMTPRRMLATPHYKLCVAAVALCGPPVLLFSPEIIAMAQQRGLGEAAVWCVAVGSAAGAAGRFACPTAGDTLGRRKVLMGVAGVLCAASVPLAFAGGGWLMAVYAVLTFCYAGTAAVQPSFCTELFGPAHAGVNYGFVALGSCGGSLLSLGGTLLLPPWARHAMAVLCAAGAVWCLWRMGRLPQPMKQTRQYF